jgi:hypothetical protein
MTERAATPEDFPRRTQAQTDALAAVSPDEAGRAQRAWKRHAPPALRALLDAGDADTPAGDKVPPTPTPAPGVP